MLGNDFWKRLLGRGSTGAGEATAEDLLRNLDAAALSRRAGQVVRIDRKGYAGWVSPAVREARGFSSDRHFRRLVRALRGASRPVHVAAEPVHFYVDLAGLERLEVHVMRPTDQVEADERS